MSIHFESLPSRARSALLMLAATWGLLCSLPVAAQSAADGSKLSPALQSLVGGTSSTVAPWVRSTANGTLVSVIVTARPSDQTDLLTGLVARVLQLGGLVS